MHRWRGADLLYISDDDWLRQDLVGLRSHPLREHRDVYYHCKCVLYWPLNAQATHSCPSKIGASVPPLKPLMSRYFPKFIGIYSAESSVFGNQTEELSRMELANFEMQHPLTYSETTAGTPSPVPLDGKKKCALPVLRLPSFIGGGSKPKELQPIVSIYSTYPAAPSTVGNEKSTVTSPARATDTKRESIRLPLPGRPWRVSAATSLSSFNVADREGWDGKKSHDR